MVFEYMERYGHEQVVFCYSEEAGLRAIIAIHDTTLGPALGGCRMWPYESEEEALVDVLRLSMGMTYKNAAMGLDAGGGKAVIIGDPRKDKSELLFRAFGRFVQSLGGRYITAEDVGITPQDMRWVREETEFVVGLPEGSGDPSPATAFGVYRGMKACARWVFGNESLKGKVIAVQGVGHVGYHLLRHLHDEGAKLVVCDLYPDRVERAVSEMNAEAVGVDEIYDVECDIFAPCALGAVINDQTLPRLKCRIVAGAANNQLAEQRHGDALEERGILYAPDFIINGGGVINVYDEFGPGGYRRERAFTRVATIYDKLLHIFQMAREKGIPTYRAADMMAEQRIRALAPLRHLWLP